MRLVTTAMITISIASNYVITKEFRIFFKNNVFKYLVVPSQCLPNTEQMQGKRKKLETKKEKQYYNMVYHVKTSIMI